MPRILTLAAALVAALLLAVAPSVAAAKPGGGPKPGHGPNASKPAVTETATDDELADDDPADEAGDDVAGDEGDEPAGELAGYCEDATRRRSADALDDCVAALERIAAGEVSAPGQACRGLSRKHVKGQRGTPFSTCVKAAAQLLEDLEDDATDDDEAATDDDEPGVATQPPTG